MNRTTRTLALAAAALLSLAPVAGAETWKVDVAHSTVGFRIRHLFSSVTGRFQKFEGTIAFDAAKPEETKVSGTIEVASIDTANPKRDGHLRSPDFFDAEKFPAITFASGGVSAVDAKAKKAKLAGTLTMHGVTKPIELEVAYLGQGKDPGGKLRAGFRATTTIERKDFGLTWNKALDAGGMVLGDEVEIQLDVETVAE